MMKNIIIVLLITISISACKKKETITTETTQTAVDSLIVDESIDYAKYGMQSEDAPKGLEKGTKAPEIKLIVDGQKTALSDLYKDQKLVLIFYRGFWCPQCNKHLKEFASEAKQLEDKGVRLIAITPETTEGIEKTKTGTGADFLIVSDLDGSIMKAFDVDYNVTEAYLGKVSEMLKVSIAENNASGLAELPVPATYVIDRDGTILYRHFDPDYSKRASIADILANL